MPVARKSKGFTLIELLIVVAIIAILAAIAVPNFLEAQTRSKVSRCEADMRSIATALEAYRIDNNHYPMDETWWTYNGSPPPPLHLRAVTALSLLTTPIAYMTSVPRNPFYNKTDEQPYPSYFRYYAETWKELLMSAHPDWPNTGRMWSLTSVGPDQISNVGEYLIFGEEVLNSIPGHLPDWGPGCLYDPTNGTVSAGDIVRVGP